MAVFFNFHPFCVKGKKYSSRGGNIVKLFCYLSEKGSALKGRHLLSLENRI